MYEHQASIYLDIKVSVSTVCQHDMKCRIFGDRLKFQLTDRSWKRQLGKLDARTESKCNEPGETSYNNEVALDLPADLQ